MDAAETRATDRDRALIAGHYVFATEECQQLKLKAARQLEHSGIELEAELKQRVKESISRYLRNFRLVRAA